jgi:hypothetical protein
LASSNACHLGRFGTNQDHPPRPGAAGSISLAGHHVNFLHSLRGVVLEGLASTVVTAPAGRCHGQRNLKLVEAGASLASKARNVAVRDSVADANDHAPNVMRIVRIGKRIEKSARFRG